MSFTISNTINKNKVFIINRSELTQRFDATSYKLVFNFKSNEFPIYKLSEIAYINPTTNFNKLDSGTDISFVPMESVSDKNGIIKKYQTKKVSESKGFTRFKENDLIWAKITPCMQNGKSAVVRNTINGFACGSTEFFIIRPKSNNLLIDYIHFILRDKRVLKNAQNYFGGSAGQQRVSKDFLLNFKIPLPPIDLQLQIVEKINNVYQQKQQKEIKAKKLLESIDSYLLKELGIIFPEKDNSLTNRIFRTSFKEITGNRFESEFYSPYNHKIFEAINKTIYPLKKINQYCDFIPGYAFSSEDYIENSDCYLITIKNISKNSINLNNVTFLPSDFYDKYKGFQIGKNNLLIAMTGATIGKVGIYELENNALLNQRNGIIKSSKMNTYYLMNLLNTEIYQSIILKNSVGGAQPNISEKYITRIEIPIPEIEKQDEIANHIQTIRNQAKQLQEEALLILENAKLQVEKMILG